MEKEPKLNILICCHKPGRWLSDDIYMPIQCGKAISDIDLGIQGDDMGDNISVKNPNYCELTAMYWAWKNLKDVDYIGLCHYRRYFNFRPKCFSFCELMQITFDEFEDIEAVNNKQIKKMIGKYDVILPSSFLSKAVIESHVWNENFIDFCILEKVILKHYPEYESSLKYVFYHKQSVPQKNMFIMRKELFDNYCEWMFDILFEVERHVKLSSYAYYRRVFAFMGEILLPLYCYHNELKIMQLQLYMITDDVNNRSWYRNVVSYVLNKIRFSLNTRGKELYSTWMQHVLKQENINP